MEMSAPVLDVADLFRVYRRAGAEVRALRGATLAVGRGETVALVGPSGSGKSTLLACAAGLDEPDGGDVAIAGHAMTRRPDAERAALRARSVGIMSQAGNLFGHLSLADNIRLQCRLAGRHDSAGLADLLDSVGLAHRAGALPGTLSGGELARGALAVALAADPPLLLADEPTAEVDAATERRILDAIERRRARGGAALIATHSPALAARATRVLAIRDGRIEDRDGRPPVEAAVLSAVGRGWRAATAGAEVLVEGIGAERFYDGPNEQIRALAPASFRVLARDRIAIMGPSGSGKTTLLSVMAGLDRLTGGTIAWPAFGGAAAAGDPSGLRPARITVVFQSPSLLPALTVAENIAAALAIAPATIGPCLDARAALDLVGVADLANKMPDELSGGQAQRVAVARALVTRPRLILADEPTGQLDGATGAKLMEDLLVAAAASDAALVVATHDPAVAARFDGLWSMDRGVLLASEPHADDGAASPSLATVGGKR